MRTWKIEIPLRVRCVQSTRGGRGHFHVDPAIRKWKEAIAPYIRACSPGRPSKMPMRVRNFTYYFQCPKSTKANVVRYIQDGGEVPYMGVADITDNMNKGVVDVCKGVVFEDDSQIWHICGIKKLYGLTNHILLEFEETPDVILINGKKGSSLSDNQDEIQDDSGTLI